MESKIILKAEDLDGYLTEQDQKYLADMDKLYEEAMTSFKLISSGGFSSTRAAEEKKIIDKNKSYIKGVIVLFPFQFPFRHHASCASWRKQWANR